MHEEYDSLGAALYLKAPAGFYDADGDGVSPESQTADTNFVLAGCLVNASYQIGELSLNSRRCLSDFIKGGGIGAYEKRHAGFRTPGTIGGTLVYGPDEFLKLVKWANHDPTGTPWQVMLRFTDTAGNDLADSSDVTGKAHLQGATIMFPEDGGRVVIDSITIPFAEREVFTPRAEA
jgi:hypothetical protein